ncbi:hypothetical protein [Streptomyces capillispiralis]|uniref:DGQHR domain-containing protein n=1 Tax=Streptomyces capillispiralis TaxID=68182 RepID=A0A561THD0_9ACTN|nr:hypothetical protein [Streptomyces capillispiralis]TWF86518.1 hypothetical protein FHX78_113487 [Streptomyces capillispiralis]
MTITPEMAELWLAHCNPAHNRVLSDTAYERYAKAMASGAWRTTHQGIAFDKSGMLLDGQHRLMGIKISGVSVEMLVIPSCDAETFDVLDSGQRRQAAQLLKIPHRVIVAAAARIIGQMYKMWDPVTLFDGFYDTRAATSDILKAVAAWPELKTMAPIAAAAYRASGINQPTHLVVLAQAARTDYADKIEDWANGLISGANMDQKDPRLVLRNRFFRERVLLGTSAGRRTSYNLIAKSWNSWAQGRLMGTLKSLDGEGVIPVVGTEKFRP